MTLTFFDCYFDFDFDFLDFDLPVGLLPRLRLRLSSSSGSSYGPLNRNSKDLKHQISFDTNTRGISHFKEQEQMFQSCFGNLGGCLNEFCLDCLLKCSRVLGRDHLRLADSADFVGQLRQNFFRQPPTS